MAGQPVSWRTQTAPVAPCFRDIQEAQMAEAVNLADLLQDSDILLNADPASKADLFALAASHLQHTTGLGHETIAKALAEREKLGSTGIGRGVAVPHAGIKELARPASVVLRLSQPMEFESPDNDPVDLVFVLVWPNERRSGLLATLGGLCTSLREKTVLQALRGAATSVDIRKTLADRTPPAPSGARKT
jgi:PTS system nitrogen regulatory IIA component